MAVIINELEVVVDSGAPATPAGDGASASTTPAAAAPPTSPDDLESILLFQAERASRRYAG